MSNSLFRSRFQLTRRYPTFEGLETRLVPAVTFKQLDLDGDGAKDDIRIVGDAQNTIVKIFDDGANGISMLLDANGDGDVGDFDAGDRALLLAPASGKSIVFDIKLGGGNDTVEYDGLGAFDGSTRRVGVALGAGNDQFRYLSDKNLTNQSDLRFKVSGSGGSDKVDFFFAAVQNSKLSLRGSLGSGADESQIKFTGNIDLGSTAKIGADLGTGDNDLLISLQGVGFSDIATTTINIRGGNDALHEDQVIVEVNDDVGNGREVSKLTVNANLLAGDDSFLAGLNKESFKVDDGSRCTIIAHGGSGKDGVSVLDGGGPGTLFVDAGAVLDLRLFGDGGADSVFAGFSTDPGEPNVLELTGTLRARVLGGAGNDFVGLQMQNNDASAGRYDLALFGELGNDRGFFELEKNLGTPTIVPSGKVLLDGGLGRDTLENHSPADAKAVLFEKFQ